jgi:glycosyltransferase involved in cell wall biosynthesis
MNKIYVFDPTASDKLSGVRGVGRYLQILKENFPEWSFIDTLYATRSTLYPIFINPFFNFLQRPLTMKRVAQNQIAVIHDLIPLKYPSHFPAGIRGNINIYLNRLALKNYDLVVTDSQASRKDIIDILRLPEEKIKVIYPCLPKSFLKLKIQNLDLNKNLKLKISNSFCLYVGDATWNKNLVNLAKAIKIINVTCVFVGKVFDPRYTSHDTRYTFNHPWQKEFKDFLNEVQDDKRFIFTGFLPDSDLIKLYQQATLNILPSRDEGFGFSYLEAGQFSTPSVLTDIPVLKEISAGNALFTDPKNPHDIADKIGEIYFDKDVRNTLGNKAFERSKFFSPGKFRKEFLRLL